MTKSISDRGRILGTEIEYGYIVQDIASGRWIANELADQRLTSTLSRMSQRHLISSGETQPSGQHMSNGSRAYWDVGHPEYATPECLTPQEAVAAEIAGGIWLGRRVERLIGGNYRAILIKENIGFAADPDLDLSSLDPFAITADPQLYVFDPRVNIASYGCHENYSFNMHAMRYRASEYPPLDMVRCWGSSEVEIAVVWYLTRKLAPFLVTRQILAGAGSLLFNNLVISGRSRFIDVLIGSGTMASAMPARAIINTKYEPLGIVPRLHLIVGDCNMCEAANLLKIGTTSLVLRMMEEGVIANSAFDLLAPNEAPCILKRVSEDLTCHESLIILESGETVSAYELQRRYFEVAAREYPRNGDSAREQRSTLEVLKLWEEALDYLRDGDVWKLVGFLDWPTKFAAAKKVLKKHDLKLADFPHGVAGHKNRKKIARDLLHLEQNYHELSADGYYYRLCEGGAVRRVIPEKTVARLVNFAPSTTRAMARMLLMRFAEKHSGRFAISSANWQRIVMEDRARPLEHGMRKQEFALDDPFEVVPLQVTKFLRHNGKKKIGRT